MTRALLTRVRFPADMLARLDALAADLRADVGKRVSRSALVRALIRLHLDTAVARPALAQALEADTVRRGRTRGAKKSAA